MTSPIGVLLVNLGTPDAPDARSVRRYLAEFLSDPRVIDLPAPLRWLLLHGVILRTRPARSAAAYRQVWMKGGSPLLVNSRALESAVAAELGADFAVALGMRYGRPSLAEALALLASRGAQRLVVLPLYPHEASSSTGSTLEAVFRLLGRRWTVPAITTVPAFHEDAGWLSAQVDVLTPALAEARADHVLFSFHGLPERHLRRAAGDSGAACFETPGCCVEPGAEATGCYRAACHGTARRLAAGLSLAPGGWSLGFQSRLGRTPWIRPFSDEVWAQLAASGVKRLAVACPGFVADCLETLEEIGLRARADFRARGGEDLVLLPCLNAHPSFVRAAAHLVRRTAGRGDVRPAQA